MQALGIFARRAGRARPAIREQVVDRGAASRGRALRQRRLDRRGPAREHGHPVVREERAQLDQHLDAVGPESPPHRVVVEARDVADVVAERTRPQFGGRLLRAGVVEEDLHALAIVGKQERVQEV